MISLNIPSSALVVYEPHTQSPEIYRQGMYDLFMEKSFRVQIADYRHFHRNWMGDIIALAGTSTAGKSSIIKELRQLETDRIEDGLDLKMDVELLKCLKKHCPDEVGQLENLMQPLDIPNAVWTKERAWKPSVSEAEKLAAEGVIKRLKKSMDELPREEMDAIFKRLEPQMFDEAFERSRRGESVIFDVLEVEAFVHHATMRNFDGPLKVVLIYCPFHILASRMEKRNREAQESGNLSNQRIGVFPFLQFSNIYSRKKTGQRTLEVITRNQAIKAFDENFDKGTIAARLRGDPLPSEEKLLIEKENTRRIFLKKLGFDEGIDRIEIAPHHEQHYHFILDSSRFTPEESAKFLHERKESNKGVPSN